MSEQKKAPLTKASSIVVWILIIYVSFTTLSLIPYIFSSWPIDFAFIFGLLVAIGLLAPNVVVIFFALKESEKVFFWAYINLFVALLYGAFMVFSRAVAPYGFTIAKSLCTVPAITAVYFFWFECTQERRQAAQREQEIIDAEAPAQAESLAPIPAEVTAEPAAPQKLVVSVKPHRRPSPEPAPAAPAPPSEPPPGIAKPRKAYSFLIGLAFTILACFCGVLFFQNQSLRQENTRLSSNVKTLQEKYTQQQKVSYATTTGWSDLYDNLVDVSDLYLTTAFFNHYLAVVTPSGEVYHQASCFHLKRSAGVYVYSIAGAEALGYAPCKDCAGLSAEEIMARANR